MRTLASIQQVESLRPIEGADKIEVAEVLGWSVVVRKGQCRAGDLCCFIEVDSIMPPKPAYEFLRERKFRVRTIKLRKQVSQGLVFSLRELPELAALCRMQPHGGPCHAMKVGDDVTALLGVTKYDPEAAREANQTGASTKRPMGPVRRYLMRFWWYRRIDWLMWGHKRRCAWPAFLPHTDEERVQNMPWVFEVERARLTNGLPHSRYYVTEKLDGQSATYAVTWHQGRWPWSRRYSRFYVCSRNVYMPHARPCTWWRVAEHDQIRQCLEGVGEDIAIQGEIVGPGVQGNKYRLDGLQFYVFNVFAIEKQEVAEYGEMMDFCEDHGFKTVPVLNHHAPQLPATVEEALRCGGMSKLNGEVLREGTVWRSHERRANGRPLSFKCVSPDFLLRYQDEDDARQQQGEWQQPT